MSPSGTAAGTEVSAAWMVYILATFIFVAVTSVLIYSVIKFRARPGSPEPRQVHGLTWLEIAWTIVPSLILLGVLIFTVSTMFAVASPPTTPAFTVKAIGHQWWWEFQYPDNHVVTADELYIPVGQSVRVDLVSDNVIHSFWVPELGGKMDVIPGHDNQTWLHATKAGIYRGECAEFCGTQHAHMDFYVYAVPQGEFTTWLAGQQKTAVAPASGSLAEQGQQVFLQNGCASCHRIDGVKRAEIGVIGPNLTHFGSRDWIAGGVVQNNTANLKDWILHAQDVKPGVDMPSFDGTYTSEGYKAISPDQLDALVAYLQSLQ
jgi:cytochrome c oxidase subunit 2